MTRKYTDCDGPCFASIANNIGCKILSETIKSCGSYNCPFYKPNNYKDYVRIDGEGSVCLISIDEYIRKYGRACADI